MRNRSTKSRVKRRESRARRRRSRKTASRSSRRGVLLLVVLSMLVLFMLVGTAFLMSSNQSRVAMKEAARQDRLGNYATRLLDRALFQIVRDTDNQASVIRYHSLLRDLYGTDGFQGVTYGFVTGDPVDLGAPPTNQSARFAGATATPLVPLGPTNGQFVDIFFKQLAPSSDDPQTKDDESLTNNLDLRHVLKLDRAPEGKPQLHTLPLTKGYYNGCLLTMTSGPAAGQSTRILDYERVEDVIGKNNAIVARIFRMRVMAFQRKDGQPLQIGTSDNPPQRVPELVDLTGQSFMVNGRPFSGTGVGYNQLAAQGQPRLSALQLFKNQSGNYIGAELALLPNSAYFNPLSTLVGAAPLTIQPDKSKPPILVEPFLTPLPLGQISLDQFQLLNVVSSSAKFSSSFLYPGFAGSGGTNEGYDAVDFQNMALALQTVTPRSQGRVVHSGSAGPAATGPITVELTDPEVWDGTKYVNTDKFLRLDLEDVPLPSFHRPDLVNFWYHRLLKHLAGTNPPTDDNVRAILQPWDPTTGLPQYGLTATDAALITSIKRQISLRPIREDHPNFDGGNPASIPVDLSSSNGLVDPITKQNITIPIWEITGPWDVDNDNDGVRDSVWVDLGDPIQQTEDGRRYKPLYAFLCVDLDSRLNVNAHGTLADATPPYYRSSALNPPMVGLIETPPGSGQYTAVANSIEAGLVVQNSTPLYSAKPLADFMPGPNLAGSMGSQLLPRGLGYGPAEISLRPVFPLPWADKTGTLDVRGNRSELTGGPVDSYKSLLVGRERLDAVAVPGRYGYEPQGLTKGSLGITPGNNYQYTPDNAATPTVDLRAPDLATQMKFFQYPWRVDQTNQFSAFGTPPDLFGRYSVGVDFAGQPYYEAWYDRNPNDTKPANFSLTPRIYASLLTDAPYELDLNNTQRRDSWASHTNSFGSMADPTSAFNTSLGQNDDSAFSPTDLEKVLRGWDADAGTLPSRLWDAVNDFDPVKLVNYDPYHVQAVADAAFGTNNVAAPLAAAQQIAGINRRLVTTDSVDLPVPNQTMPGYVSEFGADGMPGRRNDTVQAHRTLNYASANGAEVTDDFRVITGVERSKAKIADLLYYRVWLEARRFVMQTQDLKEMGAGGIDPDANGNGGLNWADYQAFLVLVKQRTDAVFGRLPSDLLAPEVLAGQRMDLNRPFGDGKDNNGDLVVDDPLEAGEPFLDVNGNGKRDDGTIAPAEPYIDLNGDKTYQAPGDYLYPQLSPAPVGDGTLAEPITFDYTNGHAEPIYAALATALNVKGGVRNLDAQGRQLYARHLYCLMLLLVDENYIAPWDEKDPQINKLLDTSITGSFAQRLRAFFAGLPNPAMTPAQYDAITRSILLRKLTCRTIAQWAINCVDARDSDVIMTPFEYDENPWDGWGVWSDNWVGENSNAGFVKVKPDPNKPAPSLIPLDGDPATTENDAWVIDWRLHVGVNLGRTKTFWQIPVNPAQPISATNPPIVTHPFNQTRGVVWGAERPELLITETLTWHDRRTEDRQGSSPPGTHDELHGTGADYYVDVDMDQRLRPKGSLFVELYNPWSPDGQFPAELYTRLDNTTTQPYKPQSVGGVDLSRLSNFGVRESFTAAKIAIPDQAVLTQDPSDGIIKRSPVWRLIVVDDWPRVRNRDRAKIGNANSQTGGSATANGAAQFPGYSQRVGDSPPDVKVNLPPGVTIDPTLKLPLYLKAAVTDVEAWDATKPPPYRAPDPDFDEVFNAGFTPTQVPEGGTNPEYPNKFNVEYPYIEREFYFTTDNSETVPIPLSGPHGWGEFVTNQLSAVDYRPRTWDFSPDKFKVRVPDRYIKMKGVSNGPKDPTDPSAQTRWARTQKFIPISLEQQKQDAGNPNNRRPVLAPVLPGRYAVVGSAGTRYQPVASVPLPTVPNNDTKPDINIYTTTVGRPDLGNTKYTGDDELLTNLRPDQNWARRIEFRPNANPDYQQVVVASNGGDPKDQIQLNDTSHDPFATEIGRDNELIRNDQTSPVSILNLTMPDAQGKARFYQPCVAIPVEGMSASEPPWGWGPREDQAASQEYDIAVAKKAEHDGQAGASPWPAPTKNVYEFDPTAANGEGGYKTDSGDASYDKPFDVAPELMRTGTTPNYRTTHLQRLANPELPWNPLPGQYKDAAGTDLYRPSLPVNPYRTIDSSSINLTAINGTSSEEHNIGTTADQAKEEGKLRPWEQGGGGAGGAVSELQAYNEGLRGDDADPSHSARQVWCFRSMERGFWSRLSTSGWLSAPATPPAAPPPPANPGVGMAQRVLWAQEPALVELRKPRPLNPTEYGQILDLINGRQMTMRALDEVPNGQNAPPKNPAFAENPNQMDKLQEQQKIRRNHCDAVMKHSLGFGNESFGLLYDRVGARQPDFPSPGPKGSLRPLVTAIGAPAPCRFVFPYDVDPSPTSTTGNVITNPPPVTIASTYPWLAWDNRPYVSGDEVLKVPAASQSQMLRQYAAIDPNLLNKPNPYGLSSLGQQPKPPSGPAPTPNMVRWAVMQAPFGSLANVFAASAEQWGVKLGTSPTAPTITMYLPSVADLIRDPTTGVPTPDATGNIAYGAPNFSRILEYVQVPSRFVGTDSMLNAETFNDLPPSSVYPTEPIGVDMFGAQVTALGTLDYDPRYFFQPPFNKVSRERDPGRVNLNTVTGRRTPPTSAAAAQIWSEVYDGIMHRFHDSNLASQNKLGHFGPAWRDVVLSRRGYVQVDAAGSLVDKPSALSPPDTFEFGLNNNFPTLFANPFRSPDAGDLVPLVQMMQYGVDASMERVHPRNRGAIFDASSQPLDYDSKFGNPSPAATAFGDARDAGFGNDGISFRKNFGTIPSDSLPPMPLKTAAPPPTPGEVLFHRDTVPLFGDVRAEAFTDQNGNKSWIDQPFTDTNRNPYMMYEPMSRLANLVTNRSGVYAIWITVGYFEVEKAPDWNDSDNTVRRKVREHFGGNLTDNDPATQAALAIYNRAYPDGYMLGKELGSETGDVRRPRGFYIIDRTEEVGFKPGEDLNVEKTIRLRRRIE